VKAAARPVTSASARWGACRRSERVRALLDKDSPFFEIGLWAAYKMYEEWGKFRRRESSPVSGMSRAFHA